MNDIGVKYICVPQTVIVRKYDIDIEALQNCLNRHKSMSNRKIADALDQPLTLVEHWFRRDKYFAVPSAEMWWKLKELLDIDTTEFDDQITEVEERYGVYDKSERCYLTEYLCPALTTCCENEKIIVQESD